MTRALRRRRQQPPVFHYPRALNHRNGGYGYVDIDGNEIWFKGDDQEMYRDLYLAVAQSTLVNFREIWNAMVLIIYGNEAEEGAFAQPTPTMPSTIKKLFAEKAEQAKCDASVLTCGAPLEEAFAIWQRSGDGLRLLAEHDPNPARAQQLFAEVAESEARMDAVIQKHCHRESEA